MLLNGGALAQPHVFTEHGGALLKSATDPAFGEAALAAIRQWRFLPEMKGGLAVEQSADLPFAFVPPAGPNEKP